ncbi:NADPH-dependent F420 reductase [Flavihumibacter sp. UBA7668]|uniref:NADPH-dependent F420 reductase n=1 Tax=Flavihumibacter sp. UBA7668 TaxID=1946542 RepID=UPI0025BD0B86|nr:NAD(P)-binding domain-containing protein [Flavihumibacter sp. UBA7668]
MSSKSKVAVIGLGNIGGALAANLVKGSRSVILADRTYAKAEALAKALGSMAQPAEIPAAIKEADIIVLTIYFNPIQEFLKQYATELEGKIIVDPSNPIAPAEGGGFKKIIGEKESSGQILSTQLPKDAKLAKGLGTLGAATLGSAAHQSPANVLFYATDDASINAEIEDLIRDSGFEPLRIGGLDQSVRIEVFGDLHEFGALGKVVTLSEAKEKI